MAAMPDRIQRIWDQVRLPFSRAIAVFRREIETSFLVRKALSAAKTLSLIAAFISILSLETAILSRYGSMHNPVFYQGMLGTVGGAVCVFVLSKAVSMVIQATRQLKML